MLPTSLQFRYLDGMRGLGALIVVLFHAALFTGTRGAATADLKPFRLVVAAGDLVVPMFTVISGYVLMLPVLRNGGLRVYRGTGWFLRRRARRILPPYYAALGFFVLLIAAVPVLRTPGGTQWDSKIPLTPGTLLSHLFLVHDLDARWIGRIDGPMWSIAVECQLYLLMPLVLLPLWRRFGGRAVLAAALVASVLPAYTPERFATVRTNVQAAHPWLLALFVAGMLAARATLARPDAAGARRAGLAAAAAAAALLPAIALLPGDRATQVIGSELLGGFAVAVVVTWLGRTVLVGNQPRVVRVLQWRPVMALGLISYSLYLFHSPLLGLANLLTLPLGLPTAAQWALMTFVASPLVVLASAGFFLVVERRFVNARQVTAVREMSRRGRREDASVVLTPVPVAAGGIAAGPLAPLPADQAPRDAGGPRAGIPVGVGTSPAVGVGRRTGPAGSGATGLAREVRVPGT